MVGYGRHGMVGVWHCMAWHVMVWVWHGRGMACHGRGMVWHCMAW